MLAHVQTWASCNCKKSQEIIFQSTQKKPLQLPLPCPGITRVNSLSALGVIINNRLTADHVSTILCRRVRVRMMYALRVLRDHGMRPSSLRNVYRLSQSCIAFRRGLFSNPCSLSCTLPISAESSHCTVFPCIDTLTTVKCTFRPLSTMRQPRSTDSLSVLKTWQPGWAPAGYVWMPPKLKSCGWARNIKSTGSPSVTCRSCLHQSKSSTRPATSLSS